MPEEQKNRAREKTSLGIGHGSKKRSMADPQKHMTENNNRSDVVVKKKNQFEPIDVTCPSCSSKITTEVTYEPGLSSWMACLVCSYLGLVLGCCLIPFLHKRFKDCVHTCPNCKQIVKRCSRLKSKK
ncbi:Hypothetical predicted protein [Mytilus galloprovincialis]|uniref:LITAF domain-containing protein n=1 Tax=Mytilus galloprovincialis TaxID=29158 RepID=A0A8B6CB94_MYTGA|nr:Hypothetical predicted protein [Mytilus galloprovincialis]